MATVETFGVDADRILADLPQLVIDTGAGILLTTARATTLIQAQAARIHAMLDGAFGAGTSAAIAALGATDSQYLNAQRLVVAAVIPQVLRASHHPTTIDADTRALLEDLQAQLALLESDPARAIGRVSDDSSVSMPRTRFADLQLSTTLASKRARRHFDGRSNLLGVDEGGFEF